MDERVIITELKMDVLDGRKKIIRVLLPNDYYDTKKTYPVLYMHDGQNLIDKSPYSNYSWDVLKTADEYHELTKGLIIVGVDSHVTKRIMEYSPSFSYRVKKYIHKSAGVLLEEIRPEADFYGEFIVNQLKPYIDSNYRVKPNKEFTFIAGSSCGGIISAYLGLKYQNVFSVIGAFSPAYGLVKKGFFNFVRKTEIQDHIKMYHDMGTKENGYFSFLMTGQQNKFHKIILKKMNEEKICKVVDIGALHNEYYWSIRLKDFLEFCFKKA